MIMIFGHLRLNDSLLCWGRGGSCSVLCRMLSGTPGLHLRDARSSLHSVLTTKNVSSCCQMSLDGQKGPQSGATGFEPPSSVLTQTLQQNDRCSPVLLFKVTTSTTTSLHSRLVWGKKSTFQLLCITFINGTLGNSIFSPHFFVPQIFTSHLLYAGNSKRKKM